MTQWVSDKPGFLAVASALADRAADVIAPFVHGGASIADKGDDGFDPVTEADRVAETAMRQLIGERFPDHGIIGEEFGETAPKNGCPFCWILDPIDGTRAFISGIPLWGTLIALCEDGLPILGVIDHAYLGERYIGYRGKAVLERRTPWSAGRAREDWVDRAPLQTRPCPGLRQAALTTTDPLLFDPAERAAFDQIANAVQIRRYGADCYGYAKVATGQLDLVIEAGLKPYDVAALIPVVEGAGGVITNWRGGPAHGGGQVVAAGDHRLHEQALVALRRSAA